MRLADRLYAGIVRAQRTATRTLYTQGFGSWRLITWLLRLQLAFICLLSSPCGLVLRQNIQSTEIILFERRMHNTCTSDHPRDAGNGEISIVDVLSLHEPWLRFLDLYILVLWDAFNGKHRRSQLHSLHSFIYIFSHMKNHLTTRLCFISKDGYQSSFLNNWE